MGWLRRSDMSAWFELNLIWLTVYTKLAETFLSRSEKCAQNREERRCYIDQDEESDKLIRRAMHSPQIGRERSAIALSISSRPMSTVRLH